MLSACPVITLGQVRGYLLRLADREESLLTQHQDTVHQCVVKTDAIRQEIDTIQFR